MTEPPDHRNERLTEVCNRYYRRLVAHVTAKLSPHTKDRRELAEDIVSRSLSKVMERCPSDSVPILGAYWRTTVENELRNEYRHADMLRRTEDSVAYEQQGEYPSPESFVMDGEQARVLEEALESLSPRCRFAFRLKVWDGLSTEEIIGRFGSQGVKVGERQIARYVAAAMDACQRALTVYQERKKDGFK